MPNIIIWLQDKMCFISMSNNQLDMFMNVTGHIMKICLVICYKNHAGPQYDHGTIEEFVKY